MKLKTARRARPSIAEEKLNRVSVDSPLGDVQIVSDGQAVVVIDLCRPGGQARKSAPGIHDEITLQASRELDEYFRGKRKTFDVPLAPRGTPFQRSVWRALLTIPFGRCVSYGDISRKIGRPRASRAVGAAIGKNPIWIIVPCHRVIGSDGSMTSYAGGVDVKINLLKREGALPP
jgi:methylated-DNA-[protein]-cysteine S-methyltransferase